MAQTTLPKETEQKIYQMWEEGGYFKADPDSEKKPYSLLMPPPNLTGKLHMGHAMQHSILDALARFKRMQGYDVLLLPGVDHAGILFEGTLNKQLAKENLSKQKLGRDAWMEKAWAFKEENYNAFHNTWKVIGVSADWSREVFTFQESVQQSVVEEFRKFWDQGLLYKGAYIVQWCPKCGTAIEDLEMEYEERKEKLYYVKYAVEGKSEEFVTIATARPETIFADSAIAVYPGHPEFQQYVGSLVINPLTGAQIPVIEDKRVDKDFGTGALKITPGHDPLDYEVGRDHDLPMFHAIDKTGHMTHLAMYGDGKDDTMEGFTITEARSRSEAILQERGAIEKIEEYTHSVPVCERCKTTVEPLVSEEWFVKMKDIAAKAIEHIGEINFAPKHYEEMLSDWLSKIHDWSISRSLWWGHRIPVWYCENSNPGHKVGKDQDLVISFAKPEVACSCGAQNWVQDEQVLDTWFSSGMWPLVTLGWPEKTKEFTKYFPFDFELTSPDIRYLWIARMIMLALHFEDSIPFKNMFFHGRLLDLQGRKFSKSLGNGIDPDELREAWGTDAMRMTLYSYSAPGRDAKVNRQIMDERCKSYRNFATKLQNLARFIYELKPEETDGESSGQHEDDTKMRERMQGVIKEVTGYIDGFQLHLAVDTLYSFVWHEFADIYVESTKSRRAQAQETLEYIFSTSLTLLHPFMPFVTEDIYQRLYPEEARKAPLMIKTWPK